MRRKPVKVSICSNEESSWDTIWKWEWFSIKNPWKSNFREELKDWRGAIFSLLSKLQVKSILDCSCGLGFKAILLAEMGYEVEGSDGSAVAIKYAPQLAKELGLDIRFFQSRYEELGKKCTRKYGCVYSDNFDEIRTLTTLRSSAKGIHSVLNKGGRLIFEGSHPKWSKLDLTNIIENKWKKLKRRKRFEILPPYEKDGVKVTSFEVDEKTSEGILENRIFLIEEHGVLRVEIAFMMNRIKWTFHDYAEVLKGAGFKEVDCVEERGRIFIIGV
jgi:SAM-dependent methyltransferase